MAGYICTEIPGRRHYFYTMSMFQSSLSAGSVPVKSEFLLPAVTIGPLVGDYLFVAVFSLTLFILYLTKLSSLK